MRAGHTSTIALATDEWVDNSIRYLLLTRTGLGA